VRLVSLTKGSSNMFSVFHDSMVIGVRLNKKHLIEFLNAGTNRTIVAAMQDYKYGSVACPQNCTKSFPGSIPHDPNC
jgi:hypothetical protein